MEEYIQVVTTTDKKEDARIIAREIVKNRLAACAQIVGPITSLYWWNGQIEESDEWLIIMKSRKELYNELEKKIKDTHPYEVPEIMALPVIEGNRSYLDWIEKEVRIKPD